MATTLINNMVDPEVLNEMLEEKLEAELKLIPYARVNNKLVGVPGDTLTIPKWNMIGAADDVAEDALIDAEALSKDTTQITIKKTAKGVTLSQETVNSAFGDPAGTAARQLAKAINVKVQKDIINALYSGSVVYAPATLAPIGYNGLVAAACTFLDEEDGIDKVLFINPAQEEALLTDSLFTSADKFEAGVAVNGAIGKITGCWVKKSNEVKLIKYEEGTDLEVVEDEAGAGEVSIADVTPHCAFAVKVGDTVSAAATPYWLNPIIKLEADSAETEYNENELPAVTLLLKKDTQLDVEWVPRRQHYEFTAAKYYGVALTNDSKVVLAKFASVRP